MTSCPHIVGEVLRLSFGNHIQRRSDDELVILERRIRRDHVDGLRLEAKQAAGLGFSGKQIIHPNQVAPVQEAFTPSPEAIAYAQRVIEAFITSQKEGKGAFALDGKMIDMPLLRNARKVLERANAAGKR